MRKEIKSFGRSVKEGKSLGKRVFKRKNINKKIRHQCRFKAPEKFTVIEYCMPGGYVKGSSQRLGSPVDGVCIERRKVYQDFFFFSWYFIVEVR